MRIAKKGSESIKEILMDFQGQKIIIGTHGLVTDTHDEFILISNMVSNF